MIRNTKNFNVYKGRWKQRILKTIHISSISLKGIGEQLQHLTLSVEWNIEWKVSDVWKTVWKVSYIS